MEPSYPNTGKSVVPVTNKELGDALSAIVIRLPIKHVAAAANRTPEAVKKWRNGLACADLASAINMGRDIPAVKWLLHKELEKGTPEGIYSPQFMFEAMQLLQSISIGSTEHADAARAILRGRS